MEGQEEITRPIFGFVGDDELKRWFVDECHRKAEREGSDIHSDPEWIEKAFVLFELIYKARLEAQWRGRFHRFLEGRYGYPSEDAYK